MRATAAILLAAAAATLLAAPPAARAEVTADCEFLEIAATSGDKPAIDAELRPVEKKLKKPPFSSWNRFKLLSRSQKALTKKKAEPVGLKVGSATVTLVEIVDKSKVRLTITMDDKGKQVVNNTTTVEAGDYVMYVHTLAGSTDGHLLSLTCK